jgi:hypothetical protein
MTEMTPSHVDRHVMYRAANIVDGAVAAVHHNEYE